MSYSEAKEKYAKIGIDTDKEYAQFHDAAGDAISAMKENVKDAIKVFAK